MNAFHKELVRDPHRFPAHVAARLEGEGGEFVEKMRRVRERRRNSRRLRASGVLLPLEYDRARQDHVVVLNKRSADVQQAGDLCLPGGGSDAGKDRLLAGLLARRLFPFGRSDPHGVLNAADKERKDVVSFVFAGALRECWEEMRLKPWQVELLGTLSSQQLQAYPSIIFPVVGRIRSRWRERPNWEVDRILRLPLSDFFDPENYVQYRLNLPEPLRKKTGMDYWELPGLQISEEDGNEVLWGATFRILLNFMECVLDFSVTGIHPSRHIEKDLPEQYWRRKT